MHLLKILHFVQNDGRNVQNDGKNLRNDTRNVQMCGGRKLKHQIRNEMKERRRFMDRGEVVEKSQRAAEIFLNSEIYKSARVIMLYMPLGNEADTREIIKRAFADGKRLVLPVTDEGTGKITPVFFEENTVFRKGGFSVTEPKNSKDAKKSEIDVVIVPGIAFDKNGARVGFGKGCYDMFLEGMDAVKIGFCYEFQICEGIPADRHDVKMNFLLTETGMREIKG